MAKVIDIVPTPSDDALWFVLDTNTIGTNPNVHWTSGELAKKSSYVAGQIFDLNKKHSDAVLQVGVVKHDKADAIAVTKKSDTSWDALVRDVARTINILLSLPANARMLVNYTEYERHNIPDEKMVEHLTAKHPTEPVEAITLRIYLMKVIEPTIVGDGGRVDLAWFDFATKKAYITLLGGCASCTTHRPITEENIRNKVAQKFPGLIDAVEFVSQKSAPKFTPRVV